MADQKNSDLLKEESAAEENSESFKIWKKPKISSELILIFLIGLLFGMAVKTEFSKRINVADRSFYGKQAYDFMEMLKRQNESQKQENDNVNQ